MGLTRAFLALTLVGLASPALAAGPGAAGVAKTHNGEEVGRNPHNPMMGTKESKPELDPARSKSWKPDFTSRIKGMVRTGRERWRTRASHLKPVVVHPMDGRQASQMEDIRRLDRERLDADHGIDRENIRVRGNFVRSAAASATFAYARMIDSLLNMRQQAASSLNSAGTKVTGLISSVNNSNALASNGQGSPAGFTLPWQTRLLDAMQLVE